MRTYASLVCSTVASLHVDRLGIVRLWINKLRLQRCCGRTVKSKRSGHSIEALVSRVWPAVGSTLVVQGKVTEATTLLSRQEAAGLGSRHLSAWHHWGQWWRRQSLVSHHHASSSETPVAPSQARDHKADSQGGDDPDEPPGRGGKRGVGRILIV